MFHWYLYISNMYLSRLVHAERNTFKAKVCSLLEEFIPESRFLIWKQFWAREQPDTKARNSSLGRTLLLLADLLSNIYGNQLRRIHCMLSQQNECCLQAIAVILDDIILFLSDWLCSSQYFVVGFVLQEEFLLKGSWKTVSHDVNRGTSPQAVSAALLGVFCVYVSACNRKYCAYWSQAAAARTQGFPLMFNEYDSSPHKLLHIISACLHSLVFRPQVLPTLQLRGASAAC